MGTFEWQLLKLSNTVENSPNGPQEAMQRDEGSKGDLVPPTSAPNRGRGSSLSTDFTESSLGGHHFVD